MKSIQSELKSIFRHSSCQINNETYLGDEVKSRLSLLLLQLKGDAANRASLDSLHQVGDETGNLVSHSLGGNDGNLASHSLVGVEVKGQFGVVLLDDHASGLLDGLSTNTLRKATKNQSVKLHTIPRNDSESITTYLHE